MGAVKEANEDTNRIKNIEYALVITTLFVILIILTPSLIKLIDAAMYNSAKLNTEGSIQTAKDIYTSINLTDELGLPFTIKYINGKYSLYENGEKYTPLKSVKIEVKGKQASSGKIIINTDGQLEVKNLKFGLYVCNQKPSQTLDCKFKW